MSYGDRRQVGAGAVDGCNGYRPVYTIALESRLRE